MKKYNYKLNVNSVFIKSFTNCLYVIPLLLLFLLTALFLTDINVKTLLIITISYVFIVEFIHSFIYNNIKLINKFYSIKHWIEDNYKKFFHIFIYKKIKYINIGFIIFSILYFTNNILFPVINKDLTGYISTIITILSIFLTLILALLQNLQNNYSDSISLINEWKKNTVGLFFILAVYTITSLSNTFYSLNLNYWVYVSSILMIIEVFILGVEALLIMNDNGIFDIKKYDLLEIIRKTPKAKSTQDVIKDLSSDLLYKDFKTKFITNVIGIIPVNNNEKTVSSFFQTDVKSDLDALFRLVTVYIEQDKFTLYDKSIKDLQEITLNIITKTGGNPDFDIYEYIILKIKTLQEIIIKGDKELYFDGISSFLTKIALKAISISNYEYDKLSNTTSISYIIERIFNFIMQTFLYQHTIATTSSINDLKTLVFHLIIKGDRILTEQIMDMLGKTATAISIIYKKNSDKCNSIWITNLQAKIMYNFINILFYIINNFDSNKHNGYSYTINKWGSVYLELFKKYSEYSYLNNTPFITIFGTSLNHSFSFTQYNNLVKRSYEIKTPYLNLVSQKALEPINQISSLYELYTLVFLSDIKPTKNFTELIDILTKVLKYLAKINVEIKNDMSLDYLMNFYLEILESVEVFIKRINLFNHDKEENYQAIQSFLENLLKTSFKHFEQYCSFYYSRDFIENYLQFLAKMYILFNKKFQIENLISEILNNIIEIYNNIDDEEESVEDKIYSALKLFHIYIFEYNPECSLFIQLLDFIKENKPNVSGYIGYRASYYEEEGLPDDINYRVSYEIIREYLNYLNNSNN